MGKERERGVGQGVLLCTWVVLFVVLHPKRLGVSDCRTILDVTTFGNWIAPRTGPSKANVTATNSSSRSRLVLLVSHFEEASISSQGLRVTQRACGGAATVFTVIR